MGTMMGATVLCTALLHSAAAAAPYKDNCSGDWVACRAATIKAIFNATDTPRRDPDYIFKEDSSYTMNGLPGPANGTGVGDVSWKNNMTRLIWTMTGEIPPIIN